MPTINGHMISLTQNRISVIRARRGRVIESESIALDPQLWNEHWQGGLMRLDSPLRQMLSRVPSCRNGQVTLLYQSQTLTKQIYTLELVGAHARDAARSKIRESVGFTDPVSVCPLGGEQTPGHTSTMLAYSDREETLRSLYAWLNRCGIRVSSMIPHPVASIVAAADQAKGLDDDSVLFYFDSDISVLAHAHQGHLRLIRPADIGFQKLVDSYCQVYTERKSEGEDSPDPLELMAASSGSLFEFGIPFQPIEHDGIELRGAVLPCMAPVLQRIGIDVKQTIRFGIERGTSLRNFVVCGPGAAIPNITRAVGEHLELHVHRVNGSEKYEPRKIGGIGSTELHLISSSETLEGLLPSVAHDEKLRKHLGRALLAGSAIALLVMGAQYTAATLSIRHTQEQMLNDATRLSKVSSFDADRIRVHQFATIISDISALVAGKSKPAPRWTQLLSQAGEHVGDGVRIQEIRGEYTDKAPQLLINGYSVAENELPPGQVLDRFVTGLRQIDGVLSVKLGATSRIVLNTNTLSTDESANWGLDFTLKVFLETTPSPYERYTLTQTPEVDWIVP